MDVEGDGWKKDRREWVPRGERGMGRRGIGNGRERRQ